MQVLKENVLNNILNSSKHLFLQKGFHQTTMEEISTRATISKRNLYNYFKSKEEIFYNITDRTAEKIRSLISFFEKDFDLINNNINLKSLLIEKIYNLLPSEKLELLLILDCSQGTKYYNLCNELISVFSTKFSRLISTTENDNLIGKIIAQNFVAGTIEILKNSDSDYEILSNIKVLVQYNITGMKTLIV